MVSRTREASAGSSALIRRSARVDKLRAAELPFGIELINEAHNTGLFFRGETFDLVNDLRRSHRSRLIRLFEIIKFAHRPTCEVRELIGVSLPMFSWQNSRIALSACPS